MGRRHYVKHEQLQQLFISQLSSGDIVLFSSRPLSTLPLKVAQGLPYDHVGLVIQDAGTDELYLLEATLSGVALTNLCDRLAVSTAHRIVVRKLSILNSSFTDSEHLKRQFHEFCQATTG
eukprot:NODE_4533_length_795_cov_29.894102_g4193_i0.p2 GENE.NODE_4533_length_795_cov_29.894102_g4193_i0~~NODE_4533_length_795_cov_29.894102_g4193_i0.p2  ORF type:complete len:120 (-),score=21.75 NODE_4533_length_795_cov_29.894102_g4193_i0:319-678(-)